ncbi:MAG: hypothetical protein CL661_04690 [Bacteroidetes bacterium]|nr:hypothetical protein [Bacteroidota bacterium]
MSYYHIIMVVITVLVIFLSYLTLSIIIASKTTNSQLSFIKLFLISFFLTPIVGTALLINSKMKSFNNLYHYKCPRCNYYFTEEQDSCHQCVKDGFNPPLKKVKKLGLPNYY